MVGRRWGLQAAAALGIAAAASMTWVAAAAPAGATVNPPNAIGCAGQAVIPEANGRTVTIDATQKTAHVPRKASGPVTYQGSVKTITHNHHGYVAVVLGPFKIHFYSWKGANASNKSSDTGTRKYPSELKVVPPGEYRVTGGHFAPQGSCTGQMTIIVDGGFLSNWTGIVALVGTVLFALGVLSALLAHPVVGAISGLFLGLFAVVDLMLGAVTYPTSFLLFGLPIIGVVVGLALGLWAPVARSAA
jgi:hypothetical protein